MGRRATKTLEDQLANAIEDIKQAEQHLIECRSRKVEIEKQIEERDMRKSYELLKENGITIEKLTEILKTQKKES